MFPAEAYDWTLEDYRRHIDAYRRWLLKVSRQRGVPADLLKEIGEDLKELANFLKKETGEEGLTKRVRRGAAERVYWIDLKAVALDCEGTVRRKGP